MEKKNREQDMYKKLKISHQRPIEALTEYYMHTNWHSSKNLESPTGCLGWKKKKKKRNKEDKKKRHRYFCFSESSCLLEIFQLRKIELIQSPIVANHRILSAFKQHKFTILQF